MALLVGLVAAAAGADAPDPSIPLTATAVVNADGTITVTASGTWRWTTHQSDCNLDRYAVGWAMDWNDASQPGNPVGTIDGKVIDVGAVAANSRNPADNAVHHYPGLTPPRCGVFGSHGATSYNTGSWGPLTHTYAAGTKHIYVCVVTYDVHLAKSAKPGKKAKKGTTSVAAPKAEDLVAGGTRHNRDNSVEKNGSTPLGNQCTLTPVPLPSTTTSSSSTTSSSTTTSSTINH